MALGKRKSGVASMGAGAATLLFFRDPPRLPQCAPRLVYAAADGRVTAVETAYDEWLGKALHIVTFLSLFDVHVNRSPVAGRVTEVKEISGGYAPAFSGSAEENHRERMLLECEQGPVVVVGAAGVVARGIWGWVEAGGEVGAGQRLGIIHFGSRTDVLLPAGDFEPLVETGQKARAGLDPMARYRGER
jgi:phosphatidylserine decarboxylase